jgi:general stress protein 26
VTVDGEARPSNDRAKIDELWNPLLKPWFDGPDDPNLQLLEVTIQSAEYWEGADTAVGRVISMARAAITGDDNAVGEHGTVDNPAAAAR